MVTNQITLKYIMTVPTLMTILMALVMFLKMKTTDANKKLLKKKVNCKKSTKKANI